MADGKVKIKTELDGSGAESGMNKLGGTLGKIGGVAVAAIGAISTAISALGVAGISVGKEFETTMAKLSTIADTNVVSISEFSVALRQLSNETGVSAKALGEVAYNAISAGASTSEAMTMVEQATKLAVGGFTDADSALNVLTTAMNAYGDSAGTAAEISDSLVMVQNLGVTTVGELSSTIGKAIATASAYGVNLGNVESAYVSMTKQGIATAEATTYMSGMFNELGKSSSNVGKILQEKTGMSFGQLMESGYTLGDVLGILSDSVDGNSEAFINLWSSAEAGKGANAIVNEGLAQFNENLDTITSSAGATESAYNKMSETFEFKSNQIIQTATNLGIGVFDSIKGGLSGSGGALSIVLGYLDEMTTAFSENGVDGLVSAIGGVLSNVVTRVAEFAPALIELAVSLIESLAQGLVDNADAIGKGLVGIASSLTSGILRILPTLLKLGMELLVAIAVGIAEAIPELIPVVIEVIETLIETLLDNTDVLIEAAIVLFLAIIEAIPKLVEALAAAIPTVVDSVVSGLISAMPIIIAGGITLFMALLKALPEVIAALVEAGPDIVKALIDGISPIVPDIGKIFTQVIGKVAEWAGEMIQKAIQTGAQFITNLIEFIRQLPGSIAQFLGNIITNVATFAGNFVQNAISAGSEFFNNIVSYMSGLPDEMMSIGGNIVSGIWNGISDGYEWIKEKIGGWVSNVVKFIKDALGIKSPSRVMRDEVGKFMAEGVVVGFTQGNPMEQIKSSVKMGVSSMRTMLNLQMSDMALQGSNYQQTINFNQAVQTPDQIARALRMQNTYGLAGA